MGTNLKVRRDEGVPGLRLSRLAWVPIPVLLTAMGVFWAAGWQNSYHSVYLLWILNFVFSLLVCLVVGYLVARSFLVRSTPGLLLLGCAVAVWGPAGVVATVAARGDANISITIYNGCVWVSALCHLAGVFLSRRPRRPLSPPALWLLCGYTHAAGAVALVTLVTLAGWMPAFYIEERGGTLMRQVVLISAIAVLTVTAWLLRVRRRQPMSVFASWYALALLLMAAGLLGVALQSYHAGILGWTGRATQALGGLYLVVAAIASVRESRVWGISLEGALTQSIAARTQVEEALRENQALMRAVLEGSPDLIYVKDTDGRVLMANPAACAALGWPAHEVIGNSAREFHSDHPEMARAIMQNDRRVMESGRTETIEEVGGQGRTYLSTKAPYRGADGTVLGLIGISHDITARKQAEEAVADARCTMERERDILQAVMNGAGNAHLVYLDRDFNFVRVNETYARACGFRPEEMIGKNYFALYPHAENEAIFARVRDTGEPFEAHDKPFEFPDQPERGMTYWDWTLIPVKNPAGHVEGLVFSLYETTDRKNAEASLRQSEERFRRYFELGLIGMAITSPAKGMVEVNDECCRLLGYERDELLQKTWAELTHPDDLAREVTQFDRVLAGQIDGYTMDKRFIRKNGQVVDTTVSVTAMRGADGTVDYFLALLQDITARKRAEETLRELNATLEAKVAHRTAELEHRTRQLQKLTLELAQAEERERRRVAVVLHEDLQQQIAGAKFHLSLLNGRSKHESQQDVVQRIDAMLKEAIEKSRRLSHDLSPAVLHMNDLAEVLAWLAKQVWTKYGLTVHADVLGEATLPSESLTQFLFRAAQEVLLNVVKHAGVKEATIRVRRRRPYVCLCISDTGRGFDPRQLKDTAGFGLLAIRERVELLGGRVKIRSIQDRGTAVRIVVPEAPETTTEGGNPKFQAPNLKPIPNPKHQ